MRSLLLVLFSLVISEASANGTFDNHRAAFAIAVNNEVYPYKTFATYVLPDERLFLQVAGESSSSFTVNASNGLLDQLDKRLWSWTSKKDAALTTLQITRKDDAENMILNVFVMVPFHKLSNDRLNNVLIGKYPPLKGGDPLYLPPDGFIEVTQGNLTTRVSPHFVLGQFVRLADERFPKYIVLRERLLLKLEATVERLNERGYPVESLAVIAGYLSPADLASSGSGTYDRHIYGGAAAVIVDRDGNGVMDDLNGNGKIDDADGNLLFNMMDELFQESDKSHLRGGLFLHSKTANRGPYILLDIRGYRKRWQTASALQALPGNLRAKHPRDFK